MITTNLKKIIDITAEKDTLKTPNTIEIANDKNTLNENTIEMIAEIVDDNI